MAEPEFDRAGPRAKLDCVWALLVLCAASLWTSLGQAQATLRLTNKLSGVELGKVIGLLEDPSGKLTFRDIRKPSTYFETGRVDAPGFGFTDAAVWVRLQVDNPDLVPRQWLLEIAYPHLDSIEIYDPGAGGEYRMRTTGDQVPFRQRDVNTRTFVFSLLTPPLGKQTYYLRVQTTGSLNLPLRAWTPLAFAEHLDHELPAIWLFYGVMLALAIYNAFTFFFLRLREYLYYSLYIVSLTLFQATLNGHTFQYLASSQIWVTNHALPLAIGLSFMWTSLFQRAYLSVPGAFPFYDRFAKFVFWASGGLTLFALVGRYAWSIRLLTIAVAGLSLCAAAIIMHLARSGHRPAKFYLVAWGSLVLGVVIYFAKTLGILPTNFITSWAIQVGAALEVLLVSLTLADRVNAMRRDLASLNGLLAANVHSLEEALERAEEATRAKGNFLATVSHELRTPLNAIINIPQALLEDVRHQRCAACRVCRSLFELDANEPIGPETTCPECQNTGTLESEEQLRYTGSAAHLVQYLGLIERSGNHLLQMVSGILDLSKMEARKLELSLAELSVAELLRDSVEPLTHLAQSQGVRLELTQVPEHAQVRADALRLKQVLINLVGNAIKFSNGRGVVRVGAKQEGENHVFWVRDEGIGIAAHNLQKIFRNFEQVDQSDTRKYGGTGLGLAISKSLVELHGGRIWVESSPGEGSTFSFSVPVGGPTTKANPGDELPATSARQSARIAEEPAPPA